MADGIHEFTASDRQKKPSEELIVHGLPRHRMTFLQRLWNNEQSAGFVHFFVNRIQDFFQTFSRPFFLFSRLKITVKFFIAREEIIVLIMKTTNKKKKTVSAV